jgi:hypothetical protein
MTKSASSPPETATASTPPPGSQGDDLTRWMQRANIPLTRENYLEMAYFGEAPDPLPAELEADLPEMFRK